MSTSIKSFGQPSNLTVSSYENGGATTVSSFGPRACLRLRADASVYSKSGGAVQIRGIGNKTFLHAKELRLVQPCEIRFKQPGTAKRMMINQYLDACDDYAGTNSEVELQAKWRNRSIDVGEVDLFNGVHAVENGLFKSMSSLVLSINGSSWQVRPSSFIDSFDKLFSECRFDSQGEATACPPYTSATRSIGSNKDQPGNSEACQSFIQNARVKYINKTETGAEGAEIDDIVYEVDFVTKLPIGPLTYASHPALTNLTDNDIHALPHIHDLSLEWSYKQNNPLMYWIKTCSTDANSSMAVDCGNSSYGDDSPNVLKYDGTSGIDTDGMWQSAVARSASICNSSEEDKAIYLNLMRPYVTYTLTEAPLARINYKPLYTVPSVRFTTYQQDSSIQDDEETGRVNFEYISVDSLSSLVCLSVFESDRDGPADAVGCRQPRWKNGQYQQGRKFTRPVDSSSAIDVSCW